MRRKVKRRAAASGLEAVRQRRSGDGGGCMYAFRICWCVVSEVV